MERSSLFYQQWFAIIYITTASLLLHHHILLLPLPPSCCASIITLPFHYHGSLPLSWFPSIITVPFHYCIQSSCCSWLPSHRLVAAIKSLVLLLPLHRTSIIASYYRPAAAVSSSAVWSSFCGSIWTKKSKIVRFCQMNTHDMNRSQTCCCKCLRRMLLIHSPVPEKGWQK